MGRSNRKPQRRRNGRNWLRTGLRLGARYLSSRTRSKNHKKRIEPRPVTLHNDYKTDYRKRRMPRRKRRRWTSFKRKVDYIADKKLGLKHWMITIPSRINGGEDASQSWTEELYSVDGSTNHKDISDIARFILSSSVFDNQLNPSGSVGISQAKLVTFESANIEVVITNTGLSPVILECYHWRCRKDTRQTTLDGYNNPWGFYQMGFIRQGLPQDPDTGSVAAGTTLTANTIGTTPFQSSLFCSHYEIIKREKFTVAPGASVQKALRIPMNRTINIGDLRSIVSRRNMTEGFLFQAQGTPTQSDGEPILADSFSLNTFVTKRYGFYLRAGGFDADVKMGA